MAIPTIPGSARVQDQQVGVKMDAGPTLQRLGAAKQAFGAAAQSVEQVAGAVMEYEQRKQQAEEVAAFNQASILTRKTTDEYRRSLKKNTDDQQWVSNWQQTAASTRDTILSDPNLKGKARAHMSQVLAGWQADTTSEFQTAADQAGSNRRKITGMLAADEALKDGNENAAVAAIDSLVRVGDMYPEEAAKLKTGFGQTIQENQIRVGMVADPYATLKDIDAGKFSKIKGGPLHTLRSETETELARQQGRHRDAVLGQIDEGAIIDEAQIKAKEKAHEISPSGAKSIRLRISQRDIKESKDNQSEWMMNATDHDWEQDKNPEKTAQAMKDQAASLPANLRRPLFEHINSELNKATNKNAAKERPVETQMLSQMREDRGTQGVFFPSTPLGKDETQYGHLKGGLKALDKMTDEDVKDLYGVSKDSVMEAEKLHYANMQGKMRDWFKDPANKDATIEQANAYRMQLERPFVHEATKAALNGSVRNDELDKLLKKYGQ